MRWLVALALLLSGCSAKRLAPMGGYRLERREASAILVPPVAKPSRFGKCRVDLGTLGNQAPGWLIDWAREAERRGCVPEGAGLQAADRIVESVALEPRLAFRIRFGSEVDLQPHLRIQVVSPLLKAGADPNVPLVQLAPSSGGSLNFEGKLSDSVIGFERAWYGVRGGAIVGLSAEQTIGGKTIRKNELPLAFFENLGSGSFFRLFYEAEQTEYAGLMIAAKSRAELEQRSKDLQAAGKISCASLTKETCVAFPKIVAVTLMAVVRVNDHEVLVPWGGTIGSAMREAGERQAASRLATLAVNRAYRSRLRTVEFDRTQNDILGLTLMGGETISWK